MSLKEFKKNNCKYIRTYNLNELDLRHLKEDDYTPMICRDMTPIYTLGKYNGFVKATNIIRLKDYECNSIEEYDNIYFNNFVLTDCKIINGGDDMVYIMYNKVTLI